VAKGAGRTDGTRARGSCQTACKPGSVRPFQDGTTIPLGRISRCASRDQPGRRDGNVPAIITGFATVTLQPPLFGLAPGGVCRAAPVARGAVRSCRTVSPLPAGRVCLRGLSCTGGLFSVALSLGSPPPAVSRHRIPVEPGLSSTRRIALRTAAVQLSGERDVRPGAVAVKRLDEWRSRSVRSPMRDPPVLSSSWPSVSRRVLATCSSRYGDRWPGRAGP
jgi:hypothetical protein